MFAIIQAAGWPIWPLLICSVVGLALVAERFYVLRPSLIAPPTLWAEVQQLVQKGVVSSDVLRAWSDQSLLGEVVASGLKNFYQQLGQAKAGKAPAEVVNEAQLRTHVEDAGKLAIQKMEKHMAGIATIASTAPLIGLLGTVIGMIEIFAAQNAGGAGTDPAQLAHGISIALYNTAFGLIIAIPALMCWRYFRAQVDKYTLQMELISERLIQQLLQSRRV